MTRVFLLTLSLIKPQQNHWFESLPGHPSSPVALNVTPAHSERWAPCTVGIRRPAGTHTWSTSVFPCSGQIVTQGRKSRLLF